MAWYAGTDMQIALYLLSCSLLFMKWKINIWRWSSMPICIVWRRSGIGRLLTIQGIYRKRWIFGEQGMTKVWHWLGWCSHRWAFDIGCDPAGGVAGQQGHNPQVRGLDLGSKDRHAAQDEAGRNEPGNLHAMLLKPVCNAWSWHLHRERCNTHSRQWDYV